MIDVAVGTAGHIDHGKTALVKALTGVDCDRLEEERRRGMTIELGFAPWRLPSGREVSIVDVPGHERFVRTMAVGARSTDLAILCVAADDGVMPQTREHAAVLSLLRLRRALVAVTKVDLAPARADQVGEAARQLLCQVGLTAPAPVATSAASGAGLRELAEAVDRELSRIAPPAPRGGPRMHVDRSFSKTGVGTVVTGVLEGDGLAEGDQVEVFPSRARGRVLGLQRRGGPVERAVPGGRLAAALRGVAVGQVPRGSVLGRPGAVRPTGVLDCLLEVPLHGAVGLRQGAVVEVVCGTAARRARTWLAGEGRLGPGERGYCQLRLEGELWALPGDRLILRAPGPVSVMAGGMVLDAHPSPHRRWSRAPLDSWSTRERALTEPGALPQLAVDEALRSLRGVTVAEAAVRSGLEQATAGAALDGAVADGRLERVGPVYLAGARAQELRGRAIHLVREYRDSHPLEAGMPRRQLLGQLAIPAQAGGDAILEELAAAGRLELAGALVAEAGRLPQGRTPAVERVAGILLRAGAAPPALSELRSAGLTRQVEGYLLRSGEVERLPGGILISRPALERMTEEVAAVLASRPEGMTVAEIRDRIGTTRRVLVPLLEMMERARATARRGDLHQLAGVDS